MINMGANPPAWATPSATPHVDSEVSLAKVAEISAVVEEGSRAFIAHYIEHAPADEVAALLAEAVRREQDDEEAS